MSPPKNKQPKVAITNHAIDRFSERHLEFWQEHAKMGEGLYTFVERHAEEAAMALYKAGELEGMEKIVVKHKGIEWMFALQGTPTLTTVV